MSQIFPSKHSADGRFCIDVVGYAEPNNGRELLAVEIRHDDKAITKHVLPANWPYINGRVDGWSLEDDAGRFIYIPAETHSKLIAAHSLEVTTLTHRGLSAATFVGNSFAFDKLVEVYRDCIVVTALDSLISAEFPQPANTYASWAELETAHTLRIDHTHYQNGNRSGHSSTRITLP